MEHTITQKELHLHLDNDEDCLTTYCQTESAIKTQYVVHTTIPHFLSWDYGRRLFVHVNGEVHELTLGECDGTQKYIREAHNMERILLSGHFDWFK